MNPSISDLEYSIHRVESSVDSLERWILVASAMVVVGVILEVYFIVREHSSKKRDWHRGTICSPEKPQLWVTLFELFSVFLVAMGVAGELGIGILSSNKNADLRNKNRILIGLVRQKSFEKLIFVV